ncbi:MAG: hypothetical protein IJ160_08500 [Muribaculaceae bacterium]|nr:hypothetical protein [Muribaculaceae bacterium]
MFIQFFRLLCGHTAEEMRQVGYNFYFKHVPAEEQAMLLEINEVGFEKFNGTPHDERKGCFMNYEQSSSKLFLMVLMAHRSPTLV